MIQVTLSNVKMMFNAKAILTPAEKFQNKLLGKFGGATRKTQQNSMKRGAPGQVSAAGKPPLRHSHNPDIKNTVFYFVDVKKKDVVIGMVLLARRHYEPMPGVLEHSGRQQVSLRRGRGSKRRVVDVRARPSATPAFKKTIDKQLPALIAGGIMKEV